MEKANKFTGNYPLLRDAHLCMAGGSLALISAVNDQVFRSQVITIVLAFLGTFLFCAWAFRSFLAGLLLIIPLAISNYLIFAYMGLMGIGLNVSTLPVVTLAVGVGVDYGIYFLSRIRDEFKHAESWEANISIAVKTTGKAILFTALTVSLGVVFWSFSSIRFQAEMGLLLTLLTVFHILGTLVLLSSMVFLVKPKFLRK